MAAKPALSAAIKAAKAITKKDVKEVKDIKQNLKPVGCYVIDMCSILLHKKVRPMEVSRGNVKQVNIYDKDEKKIGKEDVTFLRDSYTMQNNAGEYIGGLKLAMGNEIPLVDHL